MQNVEKVFFNVQFLMSLYCRSTYVNYILLCHLWMWVFWIWHLMTSTSDTDPGTVWNIIRLLVLSEIYTYNKINHFDTPPPPSPPPDHLVIHIRRPRWAVVPSYRLFYRLTGYRLTVFFKPLKSPLFRCQWQQKMFHSRLGGIDSGALVRS